MLSTLLELHYYEETLWTHEYNARCLFCFSNHFVLELSVESLPVLLENHRGAPANQATIRSRGTRKNIELN